MKILLVEDDLEISKLLAEFLQENGYEVFCQYDGLHVLDCLRENNIDLILLDIMLPGKTGWDIIEDIGKEYKVIIMSNLDTMDRKLDFMDKGALDYLVKSNISLAEILKKVKAVIG